MDSAEAAPAAGHDGLILTPKFSQFLSMCSRYSAYMYGTSVYVHLLYFVVPESRSGLLLVDPIRSINGNSRSSK